MGAQENCTAVFRTDTVGKLFSVFVYGTRRCLVCERLFTHDASREHCDVPCVPAVPDQWLLKDSRPLILPLSTGA
jgi:hypothetical protein